MLCCFYHLRSLVVSNVLWSRWRGHCVGYGKAEHWLHNLVCYCRTSWWRAWLGLFARLVTDLKKGVNEMCELNTFILGMRCPHAHFVRRVFVCGSRFPLWPLPSKLGNIYDSYSQLVLCIVASNKNTLSFIEVEEEKQKEEDDENHKTR